jgi:hypothetical protein
LRVQQRRAQQPSMQRHHQGRYLHFLHVDFSFFASWHVRLGYEIKISSVDFGSILSACYYV